jgi:hypothetical protein
MTDEKEKDKKNGSGSKKIAAVLLLVGVGWYFGGLGWHASVDWLLSVVDGVRNFLEGLLWL